MSPVEALNYARGLSNRAGCSESEMRSAIHMAYYAAFHFLCNRLGVPTTTTHTQLRDMVRLEQRHSSDPAVRMAGAVFRQIWDERRKADYEWGLAVRIEQAKAAVIRAEKIITA